jgi:hypothetical protein
MTEYSASASLMEIIKEYNPDRLIILGDVKHGVPITSFLEKREMPYFFEVLLKKVTGEINRTYPPAGGPSMLRSSVVLVFIRLWVMARMPACNKMKIPIQWT